MISEYKYWDALRHGDPHKAKLAILRTIQHLNCETAICEKCNSDVHICITELLPPDEQRPDYRMDFEKLLSILCKVFEYKKILINDIFDMNIQQYCICQNKEKLSVVISDDEIPF